MGLFDNVLEHEPLEIEEPTITESELDTAVPTEEVEAQFFSEENQPNQQEDQSMCKPFSPCPEFDICLDEHSSSPSQDVSQSQETAGVPERVTVNIEAPYLDMEPISFSVRYRHSVQQVLKGACKKHFRIEHSRSGFL